MMRRLISAALPLLLAGCSTVSDPFLETASIRPDAPALATEVSPDFAAAYLPSVSGSIESVRQTVRGDSLEQAIVYANATASSGENVLTVRVGRPSSEGSTFLRAPARRAILAEMRSALPGVAMTVEPTIGENIHGVYGYATGSLGASGSCLYAWQFAKRVSPSYETAAGKLGATTYAAQVRLRFCHPTMPRERIAALMNGMRLKPVTTETFDMLRYAAGSGYARRETALPVAMAIEETSPLEPRRTARRKVAREVKQGEVVPVRNAVRVPLPGEVAKEERAVAEKRQRELPRVEKTVAETGGALVPLPAGARLSSIE